MQVRIRVEDVQTRGQLKDARKQLNTKIKEGLIEGAQRKALPQVVSRAPTIVKPFLTAKATTRQAFITTRGARKIDRIAGLLNYGGTVTSPVFPTKAKALNTPWGPRGAVWRGHNGRGKPAVYIGKQFVEEGVEASLPGLEDALLDSVMESFGDLAVA